MRSDFEKLLNNCQSRINEESVKVIQISNGNIVRSHTKEPNHSSDNNSVRPEIQGIILQKMKESSKDSDADNSKDVSNKEDDKGQILFSLKDFLENSTKPPEPAKTDQDATVDVEDEDEDNQDADTELNEDDASVKDKSFNNSDEVDENDMDLGDEDDNDSDIEEIVSDENMKKKAEEDLESEISKLESLQKKISDNLYDSKSEKSETVLLKMSGKSASSASSSASSTAQGSSKSDEVMKENDSKLNATITVDDDDDEEDDPLKVDPVKSRKSENVTIPQEDNKTPDVVDVKEDPVKEKIPSDLNNKPKTASLSEGMFKNISISIVGGGGGGSNSNVNIQNLFNSKSSSSSSTTTANTSSNASSSAKVSSNASKTAPPPTSSFTGGPNISLKRQSSPSKQQPFDAKRFKGSSIVITSSRKDSTPITLNELINKDEDDEGEAPTVNHAYDYNNCTHGDPMSYMCIDCTYRRWKVGFDFVKTRKEKPKEVVVEAEEDTAKPEEESEMPTNVSEEQSEKAADILKNVNWQQVFSFAGISLGPAAGSAEEVRAM